MHNCQKISNTVEEISKQILLEPLNRCTFFTTTEVQQPDWLTQSLSFRYQSSQTGFILIQHIMMAKSENFIQNVINTAWWPGLAQCLAFQIRPIYMQQMFSIKLVIKMQYNASKLIHNHFLSYFTGLFYLLHKELNAPRNPFPKTCLGN